MCSLKKRDYSPGFNQSQLGCVLKAQKVSKYGSNKGPNRKKYPWGTKDRAHWPTLGYGQCMGDSQEITLLRNYNGPWKGPISIASPKKPTSFLYKISTDKKAPNSTKKIKEKETGQGQSESAENVWERRDRTQFSHRCLKTNGFLCTWERAESWVLELRS